MITMNPVVFHRKSRARVGLAHVDVVNQPMSGSPRALSAVLTAPNRWSKTTVQIWATATSGVTNGTRKATR